MIPQRLALMDPAGGRVHMNRWLEELLKRMPRGRYLEDALRCYARSIARAGSCPDCDGRAGPPATLEFPTSDGAYLLWGWCVELGRYGLGRLTLMTVQPPPPELPSDTVLRERWELTPRELEVAKLMAEGRSNADIALALGIAPNTVRSHTEKVFRKLDVRSRAEVGPKFRDLRLERDL
ncbi:MAG TPA: helix-turn-helix transcriptional regulator [Longimicrobiaceae bacterium]